MDTTTPDELAIKPSLDRSVRTARLLRAGVLIAAVIAVYWPVMRDLAADWWNDPASSYGMLIPPMACFAAWTRRQVTLRIPPVPSNAGLIIVFAACVLLAVGSLGAEFYLTRVSFVVLLSGMTATFWGLGRLRSLAFPFVLLWTMVPLPALVYNSAAAPLQLLASNAATWMAQALGITVYQDGNIIHLANSTLGVAEACSGLRSLTSLMVGAILLGYVHCCRFGLRILLPFASIPLSIGLNVLRVTLTAVLSDYRPELAEGFYHSFSGWAIFVAGFASLYSLARILHHVCE